MRDKTSNITIGFLIFSIIFIGFMILAPIFSVFIGPKNSPEKSEHGPYSLAKSLQICSDYQWSCKGIGFWS